LASLDAIQTSQHVQAYRPGEWVFANPPSLDLADDRNFLASDNGKACMMVGK